MNILRCILGTIVCVPILILEWTVRIFLAVMAWIDDNPRKHGARNR